MTTDADRFYRDIYIPAADQAAELIGIQRSKAADLMLMTIAGQESAWRHRFQITSGMGAGKKGPARGFWQFERNGGVAGVMQHHATKRKAISLVLGTGHAWDRRAIWESLETDDVLAVGFARLLLWSHPQALPGDQQAGWAQYLATWRPGKPFPSKWPLRWAQAEDAMSEGQ